MKNIFLLIILLLTGLFSVGQVSVSDNAIPPPPGFQGQCNCYEFTVNGYTPFDLDNTNVQGEPLPGYSYFWEWGDGTSDYELEPEIPKIHCFNGPPATFQGLLHLTPRKRPNPSSNLTPISIPQIITSSSCDYIPPDITEPSVSLNHPIKIGERFVVIVDAKTCGKPCDFILRIESPNLNWYSEIRRPAEFIPTSNPNEYTFSLADGPSLTDNQKRYFFELQCNNTPMLDMSQVNFVLERRNMYDDPDNTDSACYGLFNLPKTITSGPYDPNVLFPSHGENVDNCLRAGDTIFYNLRFQNYGPGATSSVKLLLDLDPKLNINTLHVSEVKNAQNASWPIVQNVPSTLDLYVMVSNSINVSLPSGIGSNLEQITCENMKLLGLDNSNDFLSTGWVSFSAELATDLNPGDRVVTTSHVYFYGEEDLDDVQTETAADPVQTNEAITSCKAKPTFWEKIKEWLKRFFRCEKKDSKENEKT